jgi:hypothetical protein
VGDAGVQESSRRGLSTFLADHEDCGEGFDIQRRDGTDGSIVRVICGGCGEALEYPAAGGGELSAEQPASRSVSERLLNRDRRAAAPAPAAAAAASAGTPSGPREGATGSAATSPPAKSAPPPRQGPRSLGWPSWLSTSVIALLIGGGLLLVILGVTSNDGSSDNGGGGAAPTPTAALPASPAPSATRSNPPAQAIKLDRRRFADRVSIGVPPRWSAGVSGGAVTVAARNGKSQVQVYFESGSKPEDQLVRDSRSFLLQRHSAGRVAATGPTRVGGRRAGSVTVAFPGGTESATVLVASGYTYLILDRLAKPVSSALRRATGAVVASFRPI